MKIYAYTRKNFPLSLSNQLKIVQKYDCDEIYVEEEDFKVNRDLNKLLTEVLAEGDSLVVSDLRVFGKNVRQLGELVESLMEKKIRFISVEDGIDTDKAPLPFYQVVMLLGELSHSCHVHATNRALMKAKENGIKAGRPAISEGTVEMICRLYHDKHYSFRKIANVCSVSVGTVHKYLNQEKQVKA